MSSSRAGVLGVLILSWFAPTALIAQRAETLQESQSVGMIEAGIAQELSMKQSTVFVKGALTRDRAVVEEVGPIVVEAFRKAGYSPDDAEAGLFWSWYWLRLGKDSLPLEEELSPQIIRAKAAKLGKLIVRSEPRGAAIIVDEVKWPADTDSDGFVVVGWRLVRVEKSGMQPAKSTCEVARNRVVTFRATLSAEGSHAECK